MRLLIVADKSYKRKKMKKFKITEISAVDRPAQSPALAVIMKRDETEFVKRIVLTGPTDGHSHTVDISGHVKEFLGGETSYNAEHKHPFAVDDDGKIIVGEANGHSHTVETTLNKDSKANATSTNNGGGQTSEENEMTKKPVDKNEAVLSETLEKELAKAKESLAKANKLAEMSDSEKEYYKSLSSDEQGLFLNKSDKDRKEEVVKSKESDKVIYKSLDGDEYRESDDPRLIAVAKKADSQQKAFAKAQAEKLEMQFEKRAEKELSNLPGDMKTHVAIIKALESIKDEDLKKSAFACLKSHDSDLSKSFKTYGTSEVSKADQTNALNELDCLAKNYAKDNGVDYYEAYDIVSKANTDLHSKAVSGI